MSISFSGLAAPQCQLMGNPQMQSRLMSHDAAIDVTLEEINNSYIKRLQAPDVDGWIIRQCVTSVGQMDLIPEPEFWIEALKQCRRSNVNDIALAIRILEKAKFICDGAGKEFWPYTMQVICPQHLKFKANANNLGNKTHDGRTWHPNTRRTWI